MGQTPEKKIANCQEKKIRKERAKTWIRYDALCLRGKGQNTRDAEGQGLFQFWLPLVVKCLPPLPKTMVHTRERIRKKAASSAK